MKKKIVILAAVAMLCACASHRDSSKTKWKETPYASVKQDGKGKKEKKSKKKKKDKRVKRFDDILLDASRQEYDTIDEYQKVMEDFSWKGGE